MKKKTPVKKKKSESHSQKRKSSAESQRQIRRNLAMYEMEEKMNTKFRKLLIQYREHHDMDQKDISVKLNEDQSTISKFMSSNNWGIPKLAAAARIMGFDFEEEYDMCTAIHHDHFTQHLEQKRCGQKKRRQKK